MWDSHAATLARLGHRVICGDADRQGAMLQRGQVPIVEDRLEELVREGQRRTGCASSSAPPRGRGCRIRLSLRAYAAG